MTHDVQKGVASGLILTGLLLSTFTVPPPTLYEAAVFLSRARRMICCFLVPSRFYPKVAVLRRLRKNLVGHLDAVHLRRSTDDVFRFRYAVVGAQPRDRLGKKPEMRKRIANLLASIGT